MIRRAPKVIRFSVHAARSYTAPAISSILYPEISYGSHYTPNPLIAPIQVLQVVRTALDASLTQAKQRVADMSSSIWDGILLSSTMKKRRTKMNKHKLKKRKKKMRFNTKSSRR
jgi:hypothetical protein